MKKTQGLALSLALAMVLTGTVGPAVNASPGKELGREIEPYQFVSDSSAHADELNEKLTELKNVIDELRGMEDALTPIEIELIARLSQAYYSILDQVRNLADQGLDEELEDYIPRINLLKRAGQAIAYDATVLEDREQEAHVIIVFGVSRALVKSVDPLATEEDLEAGLLNLEKAIDQATDVPKKSGDSKATHYDRAVLNRAIKRARRLRKAGFSKNLDPVDLARLDIEISKADRVVKNKKSTVDEVAEALASLNQTVDEIYSDLPEGEKRANLTAKFFLAGSIKNVDQARDQFEPILPAKLFEKLNKSIDLAKKVLKDWKATINEVVRVESNLYKLAEKAYGFFEGNGLDSSQEKLLKNKIDLFDKKLQAIQGPTESKE